MKISLPTLDLRQRLFAVSLLAVIPGIVAMRYLQRVEHQRARDRAVAESHRSASIAADRAGDHLNDALAIIGTMSVLLNTASPAACQASLEAELARNEDLLGFAVFTPAGVVQCSAARNGARVSSPGAWLAAMNTRDAVIDATDDQPLGFGRGVLVARTIPVSGGRRDVLATVVRMESILGQVLPSQLERNATLTIFDGQGVIRVRYPAGDKWVGQRLPPTGVRDSLFRGASAVTSEERGVDGVVRIYSSEPLTTEAPSGLFIGVGLDDKLAYADADRISRIYDIFVLLAALGSILASMAAGQAFVLRPARALKSVARRLAGGEVSARIDLQRMTGMDDLGRAMNDMADALEARQHERDAAEHERKAMEDKLRQAQRLEAVGQLAGGIAHDFNNLLTVIDGNADLAIHQIDKASAAAEDLREVRRAAARATQLTKQLLAFSRKQMLLPRPLDVDRLVADVTPLVRRLMGEDSRVECHFASQGAIALTDAAQLEQAIINLAVNARDAMPRGGTLSISTGCADMAEADIALRGLELKAGRYVTVRVSDTGTGMDKRTLARAFEPFFTTKGVGKGTGLGLSAVYGTVKQTGGDVIAESAPGEGTTISLYLPRAQDDVREICVDTASTSSRCAEQTILLVEDEPAVRTLLEKVLTSSGFRVVTADSGAHAVARARAHSGRLDLVLSDVVMPGMSALEMVAALRAERPDLPVVLMSGYTGSEMERRGLHLNQFPLLDKPLVAERLVEQVKLSATR